MEVSKVIQKLTVFDCPVCQKLKCPVRQDVNVPDALPDMVNILSGTATVLIGTRNALPGQAEVGLELDCCVVYMGEDERQWTLKATLPFEASVQNETVMPGDTVCVTVLSAELTTRVLNSRKAALGALVQLEITVYKQSEKLLCTGLESDRQQLQTLTKHFKTDVIVDVAEKELELKDSFQLDGEKSGAEEIRCCTISVEPLDAKCIGSKLVIKGQMNLSCRYRSFEDTMEEASCQLPFSEIVPLQGEDCTLSFCFMLKHFTVSAGSDSYYEGRTLSFEAGITLVVTARREVEQDILCDAYCPGEVCQCSYETLQLGETTLTQLSACDVTGEKLPRRCAFVLCRPEQGQTLWEVAKQWGTCKEMIARLNPEENTQSDADAMLLIPVIGQ